MPGGFPLGLEICNGFAYTAVGASSTGVVPAAAPGGSWTTIISSLDIDTQFVVITLHGITTDSNNMTVSIGVGSAGNEVEIMQRLMYPGRSGLSPVIAVPIQIAAGQRVSARAICTTTTNRIGVDMQAFDGAMVQWEAFAGMDAIGLAADVGTSVPDTAAYTQLTASTARDYGALMVAFDNLNVAAGAFNGYTVDIGIGGAGSEQIIIPDLQTQEDSSGRVYATIMTNQLFAVQVPAGSRISARSTLTGGTGANIGVSCYGLYR